MARRREAWVVAMISPGDLPEDAKAFIERRVRRMEEALDRSGSCPRSPGFRRIVIFAIYEEPMNADAIGAQGSGAGERA